MEASTLPAAKVGGNHGRKGTAVFDLAATNLVILLSDLALGTNIAVVVAEMIDFLLNVALEQHSECSLLIKIFSETLTTLASHHSDTETTTSTFRYLLPSSPPPLICPWSSYGYDRTIDLLAHERRLNMSRFLAPLLTKCHGQADRETLLRSLSTMIELTRLSDDKRRDAFEEVSALLRWLKTSQQEFCEKHVQSATGQAQDISPLLSGLVCDVDADDVVRDSIVVTQGQDHEDTDQASKTGRIGEGIDEQRQTNRKNGIASIGNDARIDESVSGKPLKPRRASTTLATQPLELVAMTKDEKAEMVSSVASPRSILPQLPMTADPLAVPTEIQDADVNHNAPNAPLPPPPPPPGAIISALGASR